MIPQIADKQLSYKQMAMIAQDLLDSANVLWAENGDDDTKCRGQHDVWTCKRCAGIHLIQELRHLDNETKQEATK